MSFRDVDKIKECSRQTLFLLSKYKILPDDKNYCVIFNYFYGADKSLVEDVESLLKKGLTDIKLKELYDKYFISMRLSSMVRDRLERVTLGLSKEIEETMPKIVNSKKLLERKKSFKEGSLDDILFEVDKVVVNLDKLDSHILENKKELDKIKSVINKLKERVVIDPMSGCYNKEWFFSFVKNSDKDLCLVFIDVDGFKKINDNYGHLVGDNTIKYLANILIKYSVKNNGYTVRYGGDEFILIFENKSKSEVLNKVINPILENLESKKLVVKKTNESFKLRISYGIYIYKKGSDIFDTLHLADLEMYKMKKLKKKKEVN